MQGEPIEQGVGALNISTVSNGTAPLTAAAVPPPFQHKYRSELLVGPARAS